VRAFIASCTASGRLHHFSLRLQRALCGVGSHRDRSSQLCTRFTSFASRTDRAYARQAFNLRVDLSCGKGVSSPEEQIVLVKVTQQLEHLIVYDDASSRTICLYYNDSQLSTQAVTVRCAPRTSV
jgi:hypothetical protein